MILTQQNTLHLHAGRGVQSQWLNSRLASWLRRHLHPCDSHFICPPLSSYCLMQLYRSEVPPIQQETYSCLLGSKPLAHFCSLTSRQLTRSQRMKEKSNKSITPAFGSGCQIKILSAQLRLNCKCCWVFLNQFLFFLYYAALGFIISGCIR